MPGSRKRSYTHKETADERKNDNLLDFSGYYRKSRLACIICVTTGSRHTSRDREKTSKLLETYSVFNFEKIVEECECIFPFYFFFVPWNVTLLMQLVNFQPLFAQD